MTNTQKIMAIVGIVLILTPLITPMFNFPKDCLQYGDHTLGTMFSASGSNFESSRGDIFIIDFYFYDTLGNKSYLVYFGEEAIISQLGKDIVNKKYNFTELDLLHPYQVAFERHLNGGQRYHLILENDCPIQSKISYSFMILANFTGINVVQLGISKKISDLRLFVYLSPLILIGVLVLLLQYKRNPKQFGNASTPTVMKP